MAAANRPHTSGVGTTGVFHGQSQRKAGTSQGLVTSYFLTRAAPPPSSQRLQDEDRDGTAEGRAPVNPFSAPAPASRVLGDDAVADSISATPFAESHKTALTAARKKYKDLNRKHQWVVFEDLPEDEKVGGVGDRIDELERDYDRRSTIYIDYGCVRVSARPRSLPGASWQYINLCLCGEVVSDYRDLKKMKRHIDGHGSLAACATAKAHLSSRIKQQNEEVAAQTRMIAAADQSAASTPVAAPTPLATGRPKVDRVLYSVSGRMSFVMRVCAGVQHVLASY